MIDRRYDDIASFIADIRAAIVKQHPSEHELFDLYANEAKFGYSIIEEEIGTLRTESIVLEVGAGLMLLSGYLATLGLRVIALEPTAPGFSHFRTMQDQVMVWLNGKGIRLDWINSTIEDYVNKERFDYVFSINVFEHIQNVEVGLSNAYLSLKPGGVLRIYCPNYHFPYEPHFNIPTLINKRLTEVFFKSRIVGSTQFPEAKQAWDALNWITVTRVRRLFVNRFTIRPVFNRQATYQIVERVFTDPQFSRRRSSFIRTLLKVMGLIGATNLFKFIPVTLSPVMDVYIERISLAPESGGRERWLSPQTATSENGS